MALDERPHGDDRRPAAFARPASGRAGAAVRGIFWTLLNGFVPAALAAAVFTVTSRYLTPGEFGLVALSASVALLATAIAPTGFGQALVQRGEISPRHLDAVFWLCIGVAVICYGALVLAAAPLAAWLAAPGLDAILPVIGLRVLFDLGAVVPNALLSRSMSFRKMAMRTSIASAVGALVCLALIVSGFGVWALVVSQLSASVSVFVGTILSAGWRPGLSFDLAALRQLSRFGVFATGHKMIELLSMENILIGALLGTTAVGIFGFARRIFRILNDLIAGALNTVSYSLLASLQDDRAKLREAFLFATFASSAVSFPIFVGMGATAGEMVPLVFGPHWTEAVPALRGFCVVGLLSCIGILQASLINSQGHANWWFYYLAAKQMLVALCIVAVHSYGVTAIVWTIAALTVAMWPLSIWMVLKILGISALAYLRQFGVPAAACAAMLAGVVAVRHYVPSDPPFLHLVAQVAGGAAIYLLVLVIFDSARLFRVRDVVLKRKAASA